MATWWWSIGVMASCTSLRTYKLHTTLLGTLKPRSEGFRSTRLSARLVSVESVYRVSATNRYHNSMSNPGIYRGELAFSWAKCAFLCVVHGFLDKGSCLYTAFHDVCWATLDKAWP